MELHYVPPQDAVLTALEVAQWLKLKNSRGVVQPRLVGRLGIPAIHLGHKTIRYRAADVMKWLDERSRAA